MSRCSAALVCKQLKGSHKFSTLADALNDIHTENNIRDKIVRTTTHNGSNFIKAFRVYGELDENNQIPLEEARQSDSAEREGSEGEQEEENSDHLEFVEAGALLEEYDGLGYTNWQSIIKRLWLSR